MARVLARWWFWVLLVLVAYLAVMVVLLVSRVASVTGYRADEHAAVVVGHGLASAAGTTLVAATCTPGADDFGPGDHALTCAAHLGDGTTLDSAVTVHVGQAGPRGFAEDDLDFSTPKGPMHAVVPGA